jgi:hypothetical protein
MAIQRTHEDEPDVSEIVAVIAAGLERFSEQRRTLARELEEPVNTLIALHLESSYEVKSEFASYLNQILANGQLALACPKFSGTQRIEMGTPCTLIVGSGTTRDGYFVLRTKSSRFRGRLDSPVLKADHLPHFKLCEHVVFPPGIDHSKATFSGIS